MFNDFHESTRNVGMIGILLGVVILLGFFGLGTAVYSGLGNGQKGPSLSVLIERLDQQGEEVDEELVRRRAKLRELEGFQEIVSDMGAKELELAGFQKELAGLKGEIETHEKKVADEQARFEDYRNQYRQNERTLAKGEMIDLSETKGNDFKECKILGVSPLHLKVMQKAGPIGIPYEELPMAVQDRFQFHPDEAESFSRRMSEIAAVNREKNAAYREKKKAKDAERAEGRYMEEINQKLAEVTRQEGFAIQWSAKSAEWERKAKAYDKQAEDGRRLGRITSAPGLARQARSKAKNYQQKANDSMNQVRRLEAEVENLRRGLEKFRSK